MISCVLRRCLLPCITIIVIIAALALSGCDSQPQGESTATVPTSAVPHYEAEICRRFYSVEELVDTVQGIDRTGNTYVDFIMRGLDSFCVPTNIPDSLPLYCIDVNPVNIIFIYRPDGASQFEQIRCIYTREDKLTVNGFYAEVDHGKLEITEDGFAYDEPHNSICFPAGNYSRMTITVPDTLNTYDQLKQFCGAELVEPHSDSAPLTFSSVEALTEAVQDIGHTEQTVVDPLMQGLDYFYVPSNIPAPFQLVSIEVHEYTICYYYASDNISDPGQRILCRYYRGEKAVSPDPLSAMVKSMLPLVRVDEDGCIYKDNMGQIYFPAGNTWIQLSIPDTLNTYDQLKQLCVAELVEP